MRGVRVGDYRLLFAAERRGGLERYTKVLACAEPAADGAVPVALPAAPAGATNAADVAGAAAEEDEAVAVAVAVAAAVAAAGGCLRATMESAGGQCFGMKCAW